MTDNKKREIKVLCEYCKDLVPATVSSTAEILSDCETCGSKIGTELEVKCDVCEHSLFKASDSSWSSFKISNKSVEKEYV